MTRSQTRRLIISATLVAAAATGVGIAATSSGSTPQPVGGTPGSTQHDPTPNHCVRINGEDYTGCYTGNSGHGYQPSLPGDAVTSVRLLQHMPRAE
jgi:hypothetical protein